jgi:hypothetical protein
MHSDLNTELLNRAVRWEILAEQHAQAAAEAPRKLEAELAKHINIPDEVKARYVRMYNDTQERSALLADGYKRLAAAAKEGRLFVPKAIMSDPDFSRESQDLVAAAGKAGRMKVVD